MIKSIKAILAQDKEKFKVPRKVQNLIPIKNIWPDGIFKVGNKFSKSFRFSDINYLVASREDKESMFLTYSELLNSLDSGATTKITINNHRLNKSDFEESILMPMKQDGLDEYRKEYNDMLLDKATGANGITQEKYITITVAKKDIEEARAYFARIGADLTAHFANLGSKCVPLNAVERLRILHDFYRPGDEAAFSFDMNRKARLGHDFRDYICPDSIERTADHIKLGEKYARVLFLKDYASYIKDSMFSELTELNRNLMLSIDVIPIPTDEAVREVERLLLGVETNITGWQRRQNQNNNFSAVVPYDMELQRKESKEFLDDCNPGGGNRTQAIANYMEVRKNPCTELEPEEAVKLAGNMQIIRDKMRERTHFYQKELVQNAFIGFLLELGNIMLSKKDRLIIEYFQY